MSISRIVNKYNEDYTPYIGRVVNHLPMVQWALYNLTKDEEKIVEYSEKYLEDMNPGKKKMNYPKMMSIEDCLGNRNMYEACLDLVEREVEEVGLMTYIGKIINDYDLGLSSGVFHPIIRLSYAIKGYEIDREYKREVERALAYYITSYRETKIFKKIKGETTLEERLNFFESQYIKDIILKEDTLGKRIKALLEDEAYLDTGYRLYGDKDEKIRRLLNFFANLYNDSQNIVILHCITGIYGLILLEDYYEDFNRIIDIASTAMITHIMATNVDYREGIKELPKPSWEYSISKLMGSSDPHNIKLTYSAKNLDEKFDMPILRSVVYTRLSTTTLS